MSEQIEPFPRPELRDYARAGADAGIAAIPLVGGSLEVLASVVLAPSLTKRRDAWLEKLGELVNDLQRKVEGFEISDLAGDEVFVSAVMDASRIAMGTHLETKLDLLKNCLESMALTENRDDFMITQMFRLVEDLSPEHFLVLQYLANPGAWFDGKKIARPEFYSASPSSLMAQARLPVDSTALSIVLRDLKDRGLANTEAVSAMMSQGGLWQSLATELGIDLLEFVEAI